MVIGSGDLLASFMNETPRVDACITGWGIEPHHAPTLQNLARELERENTKIRVALGAVGIDAITNMIDENIRKQRCGTYDEWQAEVRRVLADLANVQSEPRPGDALTKQSQITK